MSYQIQIRSDSANNWSNVNPVLAQAEMGYETDTGQLKFGDGTNAWANLSYFASGNGGGSNYSNANVASYLAGGLAGNFIPSGNAIQSLGNVTNQWKDLWISNNTIYINSIPISLTSNNDLTVDGNAVVTTTGNGATNVTALTVSGDLGAGNANITGNVVAGSYFIGDGSQLTNINAANVVGSYGDSNVAVYLPNYAGVLNASFYSGDGGGLSNIQYGNIIGAYGNAEVAALLASGSLTTAIVTTGTVTAGGASFSGNLVANNVNSVHEVSAGTDVVAGGNVTATGNLSGANVLASDTISAVGNISTAANLVSLQTVYTANVEATGNVLANYVQANTASVTGDLSVAGNLSVIGNITSTDVNNLNVDNALAYFGANNTGDLVDQGIITPFNNGTQQFGGWVRIHGTDEWVAFSNVTTPPTNTVDLTNAVYSNIHVGYITGNAATTTGLAQVAYSGSYTDLINTPTIPSTTSQLVNDSGFITANISTSFHASGNIVAGGNLESAGNVIAAANIGALGNIVTSGHFLGNGAFLTGLPAGYANSDVANFLPTYSGNLGDGNGYVFGNGALLTGLPATYGNANVEVLLASNTITANVGTSGYYFGNGVYLTGMFGNAEVANFLPTYSGNLSANIVTANGVNVNGDVQITGNLNVAGNTVTANTASLAVANAIIYAGANNTTDVLDQGLVTPWGVSNVQHYTGIVRDHSTGVFRVFDTTVQPGTNVDWANTTGVPIQASTFIGDGGNLSNISYANVVGAYGDANVAAYLPTNTADVAAGNVTVTEMATANVFTALGTVYTNDLSATGYASLTLANVSGNLGAGAVLTDNYLFANGVPVPFGGGSNYSNANVAAFLPTYTGDLTANNITNTGNVITTGNISGAYVLGNGALLSGLGATYSNAEAEAYFASGNVTSNVITTANISGAYILGNGSQLVGLPAGYANSDVANYLPVYAGNILADAVTANILAGEGGNISNIQWTNIADANANVAAYLGSNANIQIVTSGNLTAGNIVSAGNMVADLFIGTFQGNITGNLVVPGANTEVLFNDNGNAGATSGFTFDAGNDHVIVANTVTSANFVATANISVGGVTTFANVANLVIPGGVSGQFLQTDGNGNVSFANSVTAIPAVYFTAGATGNNQTFANATLASYSANTDITLFYNGALLDSGFYTLSGDTITLNTPVEIGDSIAVSRQLAATATTIASNPYGNANVASYLPTYTGVVTASNVTITGIFQSPQTTVSPSSATGTTGQICWDSDFIYVCVAPNTWKRVSLSSF